MNRRTFIRSAACAALAGAFSSRAHAAENRDLEGVIEMHVHCAPDVVPRKVHALDFARDCRERGYAAILLKCHHFNTNEMASVIRKEVPGIEVFGSIALNETYGKKLNLFAARQALAMTDGLCRCVWLPTQSAAAAMREKGRDGGIPVVDEHGKVLPEVVKLMELCAEKDVILASGHAAPDELVAMSRKAREVGFRKFVCTHCTSQKQHVFTADQAKICLENGAWLEHSTLNYYTQPGKEALFERIVEYIRFDPEHQFVDTDLGKPECPHPCDGMAEFLALLRNRGGFSPAQIRTVTHDVPSHLLGIGGK